MNSKLPIVSTGQGSSRVDFDGEYEPDVAEQPEPPWWVKALMALFVLAAFVGLVLGVSRILE